MQKRIAILAIVGLFSVSTIMAQTVSSAPQAATTAVSPAAEKGKHHRHHHHGHHKGEHKGGAHKI